MLQEEKLTILLIEADSSLRRLIALGLQHRNIHVIEASSLDILPAQDLLQVDLLILDLDNGLHRLGPLAASMPWHLATLPTVMLAWEYPESLNKIGIWQSPGVASTISAEDWSSYHSDDSAGEQALLRLPDAQPHLSHVTYLTKPFDARLLHGAIDQLLCQRAAQKAALEARTEALLLASSSPRTAPSIWPVISAIGLLLAFAGILLHITITIIGALILILGLLAWSLDTKTAPSTVPLGIEGR